eukprot:scaffold139319_cov24-Prasinocladus_malaysianus.AAC.1
MHGSPLHQPHSAISSAPNPAATAAAAKILRADKEDSGAWGAGCRKAATGQHMGRAKPRRCQDARGHCTSNKSSL